MLFDLLNEVLEKVKLTDRENFSRKCEEADRRAISNLPEPRDQNVQVDLGFEGYNYTETKPKDQQAEMQASRKAGMPTPEEVKEFLKQFNSED